MQHQDVLHLAVTAERGSNLGFDENLYSDIATMTCNETKKYQSHKSKEDAINGNTEEEP